MNKDLILREKLAIERTDMAIDRTFLSFIRTSLYLAVAGLTLNSLVQLSFGSLAEIVLLSLSALTLIVGIMKFFQQKKKLRENKKHIGNYQADFANDAEV